MTSGASKAALDWVWRNRSRRGRDAAAGEAVACVARKLATDDDGRLARVGDMIAESVDADFQAKCSIAALRGGVLHVTVTEPCWVSAMQRRWGEGLLRVLRERAPRLGVRQIRFGFGAPAGRSGIRGDAETPYR